MGKDSMFYGADVILFEKAKHLRNNMTPSEKLLWQRLSNNQLSVRFKPQHPLFQYIVDFYCHPAKLVIEVDGDVHFNEAQQQEDVKTTEEIEALGLLLIRFTNKEVFADLDSVIKQIKSVVGTRLSQSPL
ncbi:MAG: endonuclease domain-containing protein [Chitinophagales bacterium]